MSSRRDAPHVVFLTSPNNPTGLVEPADRVRELLAIAPGLVVVDEAYAQFADWSALDLVDESRPLVVTRTFSKTWSMAAVRLGYVIGPTWFVRALDAVVLPYHLDAAKQIAGRLALRFADEMNDRVRLIVAERERISAAMRAMAIDVTPSGANFVLFRPTTMPGREVWQALVDRSVLVRDCSGWPRLTNCLRVTVGTPEENDVFLAALDEIVGVAMNRLATRSRATKETSIEVTIDLDGTGVTDVSTGIPFYDHMLDQLGRHSGFDLRVQAIGDLHIDTHHTVEDVAITRRRGVPRGARRQARHPPLRQRTLPARRGADRHRPRPLGPPTSSGTCRCPSRCRSATRPSIRSWPSTRSRRSPTRRR